MNRTTNFADQIGRKSKHDVCVRNLAGLLMNFYDENLLKTIPYYNPIYLFPYKNINNVFHIKKICLLC